ncbi:PAS domain S-box protein [Rhodoferax sp.]|uniref:PAS domain S-box protein n=1 Tax=Rhodoferax sp. TaxID=50421 RepID=UPI001EB53B0D|nr:PAS domain S-box protein [Rhodoferax sp.]MBT9508123.1 PAS domain S-box protein [Rhodoferax sp.]
MNTAFVVMTLLSALFLYLHQLGETRRSAPGAWALAYGFAALPFLGQLLDIPAIGRSEIFTAWMMFAFAAGIWLGGRIFNGQTVNTRLLPAVVVVLMVWGFSWQTLDLPLSAGVMPLHGTAAALMLLAAYSFWQGRRNHSHSWCGVIVALMLARAVPLLVLPSLGASSPLLVQFSLAASWLDLALGMSLVVTYFLNLMAQERRVYEAEQARDAINDVNVRREVELVRHKTDMALRERDERLAAIFDLMPEAVTISRVSDGFYVEVNRSWSQMFGFDLQEAMGRSSFDLNFWVDTQERQNLVDALQRDREVRGFEVHVRCKDGTVLLVAGYCSIFESGGERYLLALMHDITQERERESTRVAMEATMREREQQLSSILDAMAEGVVLRDRSGRVIVSNAAAAEIYGVPPGDMQLAPDLIDTEFLREDGNRFGRGELPAVQVFTRGEPVKDTVMGVIRRDGAVRWTLVNAVPILGPDARNVVAVVSTLTDITRMKEIETRLRDRDAFQTRVFQLVPDTLTITRMADGRYVDVNRNWETLTGYTPAQTIGRTSLELGVWGSPEQRAHWIEAIHRDGELRDFEATLRNRHGELLDCRLSGSKFEAGGEDFLLFSIKNVMQEKAAEAARLRAESLLRDSEFKFSSVFQLSPVPLGLTHVESGKFVEVNDAWLLQFGFDRDDVIGRTSAELKVWVDLGDRQRMMDEMRRRQAVDRLEIQGRRRDGQIMNCLLSGRTLVFNDERMFIFAPVDVTRQREIEREIREINHELEERVRLRTLKLEQANGELAATLESLSRAQNELVRSEKMAALGSLVAGVAHELNTPIGNSVTVASTLHDQTRELLQDIAQGTLKRSRLDTYLNNAATGSDLLLRSLGVARDLVSSFKQVAVDQSSNQRRRFDLRHVMDDLVVTLGPMFKKTRFRLDLDLAPGIELNSYPGPLGQVVTNLISNALSHAFDGRDEGVMCISSRWIDTRHVELSFSDDGVGIPEKNLARVFDPFFTTRMGQGGSGLGMNIVYNIVTGVLGGDIQLASQVGKGTQVTIRLPLAAPESVTDPA